LAFSFDDNVVVSPLVEVTKSSGSTTFVSTLNVRTRQPVHV